jgi:hypothetical protein
MESGEVVAGYRLAELEAGLIKTVSPRESQEKSVAASATSRTAARTSSSLAPWGRAFNVTRSLASEKCDVDLEAIDLPLDRKRGNCINNSPMVLKNPRRSCMIRTPFLIIPHT